MGGERHKLSMKYLIEFYTYNDREKFLTGSHKIIEDVLETFKLHFMAYIGKQTQLPFQFYNTDILSLLYSRNDFIPLALYYQNTNIILCGNRSYFDLIWL